MSLKDTDLLLVERQNSSYRVEFKEVAEALQNGLLNQPIAGLFGNGSIIYFFESGTFKVPNGITSLRARVWGAGGSNSTTGGTSSFGNFCSATGGGAADSEGNGGTGGSGKDGDVNQSGGKGGPSDYPGGGGAANLYGEGGVTSGNGSQNKFTDRGEAGLLYPGGKGGQNAPDSGVFQLNQLSIDLLGTGGGGGAGNYFSTEDREFRYYPGSGWNGGGGGGDFRGGESAGGKGGFPGGGAGGSGPYATNQGAAGGGGGFSMKVCNVSPGQSIAVTVGLGGNAGTDSGDGGDGLVIVEY